MSDLRVNATKVGSLLTRLDSCKPEVMHGSYIICLVQMFTVSFCQDMAVCF